AERARARVLVKLGRRDDAILALEQLATASGSDEGAGIQVLAPLLELLVQGDDAQRMRAFAIARQIAQRAPESRAGARAEELMSSLLKSFPESLRRELTRARPEDRLQRADGLLAELRYKEAASAYAEAEKASDDADLACRARYGRGKALLDGRVRAEGSEVMLQAVERCANDPERLVWARYHAGRALASLGQNERAIAQFEGLVEQAPKHSLADDALYRAARAARDMGDPAGLVSRLQAVGERYPHGDMRLRAHFTLAWEAHARGDLAGAIALLAADERDEPTEDVQGRSAYFRARWLAESGDQPSAVDAYAAAFEHAPLSFYGQLAHTRLRAAAPERAHALVSRLSRARGERLTFEQRPELSSAGFRRAVALLEVGEATLASVELKGLGFTADSADVDLALLAVALLDRADAPELSVSLARRHMPRLMQRPPHGSDVALYELVYPVAFAPVIESTAKRESVPAAFLRAVAREESGFNPAAVSRAHAYGLVQLLVPTARALVQTKRERVRNGHALLEPQLNLTLGARFMASLANGLRQQYALVPAAYNAGPAAVARWLRERGAQPLDEFVENIPYDETRQYTRRVVQSYGVYHWLATAEMLPLPLGPVASLPAAPLE
ncbi:MAG: transglycosylase SLT domain-containing protein, partial [Polyangiales bacterium]